MALKFIVENLNEPSEEAINRLNMTVADIVTSHFVIQEEECEKERKYKKNNKCA